MSADNQVPGGGTVLVTGGTGTVGSLLSAELVRAGLTPRLLVRPSSASAVPAGCEPVVADTGDSAAVRRALDGVDSLFLLTPLSPRQDLRQIEVIEAAVEAGVRRIVKVSALGADPESPVTVHREHGRSDAALSRTGVSHVILRPNAFMQNVLQWRAAIVGRGRLELPMGRSQVSMVDARDVAASACAALLEPERFHGVFELTGPESLDYSDIAARVSAAVGREVRYVDAAPEAAAANMRAGGVPEWAITARLELYGSIRSGAAAAVSPDVARILGRRARCFDDFLDGARPLLGRPSASPRAGSAPAT